MFKEMKVERNLVVLHFHNNRLLKGYAIDFTPLKETFYLVSEQEKDRGTLYEIKCRDLKAVFFVKSLEGDRDYKEKKKFAEIDEAHIRGLKIRVIFNDGEIIRGISLGYSKARKGFFVVPLDPLSNNRRIYVMANALRDVKVGSAAEQ